MKKIIVFGLLLNQLLIPIGYTQEPKAEFPSGPEIKPTPPYIYQSGNRRDPFKPLVTVTPKVEAPTVEAPKVEAIREIDILSLRLSGLIWDGRESVALLHDGGGFGYILKGGRLLGSNYRVIKGIYGRIKRGEVYLRQGETEVSLTLEVEKD